MSDEENTGEDASQDDIDKMFDEEPAGNAESSGGDDAEGSSGESGMSLGEIEGAEIQHQKIDSSYEEGEPMAEDVTAIYDIPVQISAVLGRSTMQVSQLLKLGRGAVVELDRKVGEAIDIYVNNRLVARGEVVVVEDKLGVTMTEIVKSDRS